MLQRSPDQEPPARAAIDDYLAGVPDDKRSALTRLRDQIRTAAPQATEAISFGLPAFRLGERYILGFGTTKRSCSFYAGRVPVQACADELASYRVRAHLLEMAGDSPAALMAYEEAADLAPNIRHLRRTSVSSGTFVRGPTVSVRADEPGRTAPR